MDLNDLFSYHAPTGDQPQKYEAIRDAAKVFAKVLIDNTPSSTVQTKPQPSACFVRQ